MHHKRSSFGAPSFYKIFFSDFSTKLRIPIEFGKNNEEILPQVTLLESNDSIISWDVKIIRVDKHFFITNGWANFVKDKHLTEMDFLVFHLINTSSLQVAIYGKDGCLKERPSSTHSDNFYPHPCRADAKDQTSQRCKSHVAKSLPSKEKTSHESSEESGEVKSFTKVIMESYLYHMNLQGKDQWPVRIKVRRHDGGICMQKGWNDFRRAHKLGVGAKCRFEFDSISGNLILKNEMDEAVVSSAKRRRGRPPINGPAKINGSAKRGRGRPPKINVEQQTSSDASIYEVNNNNGCEKEISDSIMHVVEHSDSDEDLRKEDDGARDSVSGNDKQSRTGNDSASEVPDRTPEEENPLYFEILLRLHHRFKMSLPKDFWVAAELSGKETVGMEYLPTHRYQSVALYQTQEDNEDLIKLANGWPEFRKGNGIVVGKRYAFEFKPSENVIQVKEVKNTEGGSSDNKY